MALEKQDKARRLGWGFLVLWAVLIGAGIVTKRFYDHPDWMVFFHLPAAVFLVMAFRILSADFRAKYRESMSRRASTR